MEPTYEVVSPEGRIAIDPLRTTPAVADLNRAVVAELWDWRFRGEEMFRLIEQALQRRYPGIRFVPYQAFGNIHAAHETAVLTRLPELLREHECTAVIAGVGA